MLSVPEERTVIDHEADEKSVFKTIDWVTNFVIYPDPALYPPTTNLWIIYSRTYLPEDDSNPHPKTYPPEGKDMIENVDEYMLYITSEGEEEAATT